MGLPSKKQCISIVYAIKSIKVIRAVVSTKAVTSHTLEMAVYHMDVTQITGNIIVLRPSICGIPYKCKKHHFESISSCTYYKRLSQPSALAC